MERKYGLRWQKKDDRDKKYLAPRHIASALPPSFSLLSKFPDAYDQLQVGSCTGNAGAGGMHYLIMMALGIAMDKAATVQPSRLFIYYNERVIEGTVREDAGAELRDCVKTLNKQGVCFETEWPYIENKFTKKPAAKCYTDAKKHTLTSYEAVDNRQINDIKSAIVEGWPVVLGFSVYSAFESDAVAKTGILNLPAKGEKNLGGHAVVICGYSDSLYDGKGGLIIRNSWGKDWGQNGYFTMPYSYATNPKLASDFWAMKLCS